MNRILLTAPFVGEIGWELMAWQARVRWVFTRGSYDRVVVLGGAGKAAFYDGMPTEYRPVDLADLPGNAYEDRRIIAAQNEIIAAERIRELVGEAVSGAAAQLRDRGDQVDILWPEYSGQLWCCDESCQRFIQYERRSESSPSQPWVVCVQRTRAHGADRNWPAENWLRLADRLADRGIRTTVYPCEAEAAITALSGCDLAIGQSTGGLHLATLCGCPSLVWSVQRYLMWPWEITNRQRYETWWNPFGSPVVVHDVPQLPAPEQAARQVMSALAAIGRRTGSPLKRAVFRGKWRFRSALRRHVIAPRRYANWPWPVQSFVRYQLA